MRPKRYRIKTRSARVGIVGLGYVGLPLAIEFAKAGFSVTGIDVQEEKVARLNLGGFSIFRRAVCFAERDGGWQPISRYHGFFSH